ncbi:hypothetical protein J2X77_001377 [Sphingobacterium sp. 2149]|nr:hypothetical protein [Sphingobacterium sp. 2149]
MYFHNASTLGTSYLQLEVGYQESIIWSNESLNDAAHYIKEIITIIAVVYYKKRYFNATYGVSCTLNVELTICNLKSSNANRNR